MSCKVDGCTRPVLVQKTGECKTHYHRRKARESAAARAARAAPAQAAARVAEFWSLVDERGPAECWPWTGPHVTPTGYGLFRGRLAHRIAFDLAGPEPLIAGLTIDHHCGTRLCMNPAHLEQVTRLENTLRAHEAHGIGRYRQVCPAGLHPMSGDNLLIRHVHGGDRYVCLACKHAHAAEPVECETCGRTTRRDNATRHVRLRHPIPFSMTEGR